MQNKLKNPSLPLVSFLLFLSVFFVSPPNIWSSNLDYEEELFLLRGDLTVIGVTNLERISVTDPNTADIVNVGKEEILLLAKQPGATMLFIWDDMGKRAISIHVSAADLQALKTRIQQLLKKADIDGVKVEPDPNEGKIILTGTLPSDEKDSLDLLIEPFATSIMNLVKIEVIEDLVQIEVQIVELNRTYEKNVGIDWQDSITVSDTPPSIGGKFRNTFRLGDLDRTAFDAVINMFIKEGKGRILSNPKLVVVSGKEASFQVGGEIPIRTTTSTTSAVTENIEYRDFGITLTITPTIRNGKVDIVLSVEVSEIDSSNKVGENVAFATRNAQTQLYLDNEQTIILAGLIKKKESRTVSKVPILGDIPIIGLVFRSVSVSPADEDTELVVSLTPTILAQKPVEQTAAVSATKDQESHKGSHQESPKGSQQGDHKAQQKGSPMGTKPMKHVSSAAAVSVPSDMAPYVRSVQKKISQSIQYPLTARDNGWEGAVTLYLHILKDGTLYQISVKRSSGYDILDQDALMTAQNLAPYAPIPSELGLDEILVTVPIIYSQGAYNPRATL